MNRQEDDPDPSGKFWPRLAAAVAVASCLFVVWGSAAWSMEYLGYYNDRQCGTGRMGALGTVMLAPLLASVPAGAWLACAKADVGVAVARGSAYVAIAAASFASVFVLVAEHAR
jgi:hypothetical protein